MLGQQCQKGQLKVTIESLHGHKLFTVTVHKVHEVDVAARRGRRCAVCLDIERRNAPSLETGTE